MMLTLPRDIQKLFVDNIYVGDRFRKNVDPDRVAALAASIKDIGLMTPITFRTIGKMTIDGVDETDVPVLVAGLHRLEACKSLGLEEIACIEIDGSDIDAQLWEIAENLHRAELTALERDQHIAKWVELSDQRILAQSGPKIGKGRPQGGTRAAARELGIQRNDAQRAIKVAALSQDAKDEAIRAGLDDNRTALLAAAKKETPAAQKAVIRDYADKKSSDRSKIDADVKTRAAKEVAQMLAEHIPSDWWDALKANLYAAGANNIAAEFTNITGQSIMDRRFA